MYCFKAPRQVRGGVARHVYTPGTVHVFDNAPQRESAGRASHSSAQPGYLKNNHIDADKASRLKRTCKSTWAGGLMAA